MATRKTARPAKATKPGRRKAGQSPAAQTTGNWFTDAMSEANAGIVRGSERRSRKK